MSIQILNTRKNELCDQMDKVVNAAAEAKRSLTKAESEQIETFTNEVMDLDKQIKTLAFTAAGRAEMSKPTSQIVVPQTETLKPGQLSAEYRDAFLASFKGGASAVRGNLSKFVNAALGEGGTTDGGYLVPTIGPEGAIIALAPQEASLRKLALVISTTNDLKIAAQATKSTVSAKAESRAANHAFASTNPAFAQVTLGAYMAGAYVPVTFELAQDVAALQPFLTADLARGVNNFDEHNFVNGSGSGEPQGILAGADAGQTSALTAEKSLDFTGVLNAAYYSNAQWLMHRLTGIQFRKQQLTDNQFIQYWQTVGGVDYLHGFKVNYSSAMPVYVASPAVNGAIAFGDFAQAMVIGDRGGPALQVVTDNITQLENGVIRVYGYRRTDSRVRLPEAVKIWTVNG